MHEPYTDFETPHVFVPPCRAWSARVLLAATGFACNDALPLTSLLLASTGSARSDALLLTSMLLAATGFACNDALLLTNMLLASTGSARSDALLLRSVLAPERLRADEERAAGPVVTGK